jgi:uncharacterized membrane protein required for colicin V production
LINNIFDFILAVIILVGTIVGARKGFFKSILRTFAGIISVVLAWIGTKQLSAIIKDKFVYNAVEAKVSSIIGANIENSSVLDSDALIKSVPDAFRLIAKIAKYDINDAAQKAIDGGRNAISDFSAAISSNIANIISVMIAFVVILLISNLALRLLAAASDVIFKNVPILKQINAILGFAFGFVCSVISAWIFSTTSFSLISLIRTYSPDFLDAFVVESTYLYKFFLEFYPISFFMGA